MTPASVLLLVLPFVSEPKLTVEDAQYLDKLLTDFLFDPTGAERIRGEFPYHSVFGSGKGGTLTHEGWLVRGKNRQADRVFFADGASAPAPAEFIGVEFVQACRHRYTAEPPQNDGLVVTESDLVRAAWLHKLGHDDLAARALAAARKAATEYARGGKIPDPRDLLRADLAWSAFADLVDAFANHDDETALEHGTRLFKLYRDIVRRDERFWQAEALMGELSRRKKAGTFGNDTEPLAPNELPKEINKRVPALIAALEDAHVRQWGMPGGVFLRQDWRVSILIECGEAAIPALIAAFEKDNRLTGSTDYHWHQYRHVHPVREAERIAIESILQVTVFDPQTGQTLSRCETVAEQTAMLCRYWDTYGKLPFDERMMKILTDPKSSGAACRKAADNLASLHERQRGWFPTCFGNPAVTKFTTPTVAEAMLTALDRRLNEIAREKEDKNWPKDWLIAFIEDAYLKALVELGDRRIAQTLAKRAAGAETNTRRRFAFAAFRFGEPRPLEELAKEFEVGSLTIHDPPKSDAPFVPRIESDLGCLGELLCVLSKAQTPFADRALLALADPKHPYHRATCDAIFAVNAFHDTAAWIRHPFWLLIARRMLDDTTPTGRVYKVENDWLHYKQSGGNGMMSLPDSLADAKLRKAEASERVCDRIGINVSCMVAGLPPFHPMRIDSEQALDAIKTLLDRFAQRIRPLNYQDSQKLRLSSFDAAFIPDIKPLAQAATADDIIAGRAIFHLSGKGQAAGIALPAWVELRKNANDEAVRGYAVQAEIGADGTIIYGVIFRHGMRAVPAAEVEKVEPVKK